MAANGYAYGNSNGSSSVSGNSQTPVHTVTALKRWSCDYDTELPAVDQVKAIHVYDFDNTLFASPLPNRQVWHTSSIGQLQTPDVFVNGGWWHDAAILASTGDGEAKEEPRAWKGWWNEQIVQLVELSMQQKDALSVLLTGRAEGPFADLVKKICKSKNLHFHMTCLKPAVGPGNQKFSSTMNFKQALLRDLVHTYCDADEIRVYEDRPKHVTAFRNFFADFNSALHSPHPPIPRKPIVAEVIQVAENATTLDPVSEVAEVQRMMNGHNLAVRNGTAPARALPLTISKQTFYTRYLIHPRDTERLCSLVSVPPKTSDADMKWLANNIMIKPGAVPASLLHKVGGMGAKRRWRVTGVALFENRLWAARVVPVRPSPTSPQPYVYTDHGTPNVVLAMRGRDTAPRDAGRIQNWQPVPDDKAFEFETTVGEKVLLRIEQERRAPRERERKRPREEGQQQQDFIRLDAGDESQWPALGGQDQRQQQQARNTHPRNAPQPEDRRPQAISANQRAFNQNRGRGGMPHGQGRGGREYHHHGGSRGGARGGYGRGGGGGGGGGRGRGRGGGYKSLDDVGAPGKTHGLDGNYDDGGMVY